LDRRHAQSGVFVLVASVTGVLGAGEEVAVDFGLEDGGDEVGGRLVTVAVAECVAVPWLVGATEGAATGTALDAASDRVGEAIRRSKGDSALFAAADVGEDDRPVALAAIPAGRTVGLKSLSPVLDPGVDTKPAARNSSARTASVRARRGRTHSLLPSVAS
jgi:hypothetical protein